ncbi:MAG: 3-dehydroquinate synthase family protein [Candidatus Thorarchaeota archaeon]|jgi:3-dehydroquinate synthase
MIESHVFARNVLMRSEVLLRSGLLREIEWFRFIPEEKRESVHFVVTDSNVGMLYADIVTSRLNEQGMACHVVTLEPGESSKAFTPFRGLVSEVLDNGVDKYSIIFGLGGGVVNNISGFLASTLYRGLGLIQIPTSLMAQTDAAIDFKQAINDDRGKNLVGSYYPASIIAVDPDVLRTLSDQHIRNGLAECIKHALSQDSDFLAYLQTYDGSIRSKEFLESVVATMVRLKIPMLNDSTNKDYAEMLLQYGHGIGHVFEHLSGYSLLHGEAISVGMCVMSEVALALGICDEDVVELHYSTLARYGLPTRIPYYISDESILRSIKHDKHYSGEHLHVALISEVGSLWSDEGHFDYSLGHKELKHAIRRNREKDSFGGNKRP